MTFLIRVSVSQSMQSTRECVQRDDMDRRMIPRLIPRTFRYLDTKSFLVIYKTLVRTHLDYASSVWAPYKMKQAYIEKIESVQKRVTKKFLGMKNLSYPERLKKLGLPTLAYRRIRGDMIEVYKIIKGCYDRGQFINS